MADTLDLLDQLLEEALTPPSGPIYSPKKKSTGSADAGFEDILNLGDDSKVETHPKDHQLPLLPLDDDDHISPGSDQDLDLLTPLAAEVDDMVVPFTAAESSVDSSADASLPIVGDKEVSGPETTGAVGSSMQIGVSAEASLHSVSDLWSIEADEGDKDASSGDESRTDQPPSVTELAEPVTEQSSERKDSSIIPVLGLFESLPSSRPTEGFGSALPPIPELSTGRTSSAGQHDPSHREAAGLLGDPPELAAPSIPLAGSAPVTAHVELPSSETAAGQTVRDWLRRMERVRPQDVFVTNARTGGHRVGQVRSSQSIVDQGPTILYRIDIGRVSAPPIPSSLVRGVMVSYRLYVTLFHLKTQVITSRTAVGLKVDSPAGHDFDMSGSFLYHTGSSLPDAQTGVILELALTLPDGERLSAGWTVIPADHALSRGAVLLEGTPRVLPFLKREVIGAFATTQQPTGSLVGLATGGSLEVTFCSLSGEEQEANTIRRMLPAGYVAAAGIPVGCLQTTHITRAGVTIGGITVDIGSHHATAELRDAIRFAARDFSQRFKTPDSNERVELSNRYTVTVYAHNGLQRISPEWAFRMEGDNSGNPVLVSSTYHTIDMVLDDNCALAVELHCHLVEEEPNDVPVCVGWCLLLLPYLDPLTECIASDQTSNSVLLRCHLMSGPGETIAGRKVWIGSPAGIHHSIEFTLTGEAYASWLRARQRALHAELLAAVPISVDKTVVLAAETEKIPQSSLVLPPPPEAGVEHFVDPPSELPAPAMLFESRHVESSPLSPPEPAEQLHRSEVDSPRASEVDPPRASEVDPLRPSEVDPFRPSEVEPLRSSETEQQGSPDVESGYLQAVEGANAPLIQPLIPSISGGYSAPDDVVALTSTGPVLPVASTTGNGGGLVPEGMTRHSLQDAAKTRYDDPILDLGEPEVVSVNGAAASGSSPITSVKLNPQAGRKPDSPTPRNIPLTNEAPEGIVAASTAEQEVMTAVNWRVEEEDELVNDEISLAIVGWRPVEGSRRPGGKRVYFSAQFYTFPAQNTEVAELPYDTYHSALSSLSTGQRLSARWGCCCPSRLTMLRRVTGRDGHGIDLEMHCAETGMLVATASVPLGGLPRQHRMVARFEREVSCSSVAYAQEATSPLGWLHVVIENRGSRDCAHLGHRHPFLVPSCTGGYVDSTGGESQPRSPARRKNARVKALRLPRPDGLAGTTHDATKHFEIMRERSRSKLVQRRIRETLLEKRYLPAISGEASYFTVPFTNPLSVEALYSVRVGRVGGDSNLTVERSRPCGLSLVTDPIEWRYIVKSRGFSEPNSGYELFTATAEFLLRPGQMVELPFRFLSLIESEADLIFEISIRRSGGEIARVVELVIPGPLGFLVDQVARCWELEGAAVRKTLSLAKEVETDASLVISPDDSGVSVTRANEQPRQLCISLMAPGAIERPREAVCLVYTRSDIYRERPMSVVRIICYALFGDYVKGVVGQPIHKAIKLPPQLHHGASSIVAYSTNSALAEIEPSHIRVPRSGPCHLPLSILPSISGMSTCLFFVAKDGEASAMGRPLVGWVLNIQAEPPTVTETHDLTLTYGQQSRKRLPFRNPLTRQTEFMMSSSNPDILQVVTKNLKLAPLTVSHIDLLFPPVGDHTKKEAECFLFISTSDGQISDTRLFKLSYTPEWPGPPAKPHLTPIPNAEVKDSLTDRVSTKSAAVRRRSLPKPKVTDSQSTINLHLVLNRSLDMGISSERVEELVRTTLSSVARLPAGSLQVSGFHWDDVGRPVVALTVQDSRKLSAIEVLERIVAVLDEGPELHTLGSPQQALLAGATLRPQSEAHRNKHGGKPVTLQLILRLGSNSPRGPYEIREAVRAELLRSSGLPPGALMATRSFRNLHGQHVVILVLQGFGELEASDAVRLLRASLEEQSTQVHPEGPASRALLAGAKLYMGEDARCRASTPTRRRRSVSVSRRDSRSQTPSRRGANPKRRERSSVDESRQHRPSRVRDSVTAITIRPDSSWSRRSSLAEDFAAELEAWGKDSMASLLDKGSTRRYDTAARKIVNEKNSSSGQKVDSYLSTLALDESLEIEDKSQEPHPHSETANTPKPKVDSQHQAGPDTDYESWLSGEFGDPMPPVTECTGSSSSAQNSARVDGESLIDKIYSELESLDYSVPLLPGEAPDRPRAIAEADSPRLSPYFRTLFPFGGFGNSPEAAQADVSSMSELESLTEKVDISKPRRSDAELPSDDVRHRLDNISSSSPKNEDRLETSPTSDVVNGCLTDHDANVVQPTNLYSSGARSSGEADALIGRASTDALKSGPISSQSSDASARVSESSRNEAKRGGQSQRAPSTSVVSAVRKSQIVDMLLKRPSKQAERTGSWSSMDNSLGSVVSQKSVTVAKVSDTAVTSHDSVASDCSHPGDEEPSTLALERAAEQLTAPAAGVVPAALISREGLLSLMEATSDPTRVVESSDMLSPVTVGVPPRIGFRDDIDLPARHPANRGAPLGTAELVQSQTSAGSEVSSIGVSSQLSDGERTRWKEAQSNRTVVLLRQSPEMRVAASVQPHETDRDSLRSDTPRSSHQSCSPSLLQASQVLARTTQESEETTPPLPAFSPPSIEATSTEIPHNYDPSWLPSPLGNSIFIVGHVISSRDAEGDGEASWAVAATAPYRLPDGSGVWQCMIRSLRSGIAAEVSSVGLGIGICSNPAGVVGCNMALELPSSVMLGYECSGVFANGLLRPASNVADEHWARSLKAGDTITLVFNRDEIQVLVNWVRVQSEMLPPNIINDPHLVVELVGSVASLSLHGHYQIGVSAHRLKHG